MSKLASGNFLNRYGQWLLLPGAVALIAVLFHIRLSQRQTQLAQDSYRQLEGPSELMVVQGKLPARQTTRVLFTGNSITSVNNLPYMFTQIAASDPVSAIRFEVQSDTHSGQTLAEVWKDGHVIPLLASRPWTYVVLQEHSWWIGMPDEISEMYNSVGVLSGAIRKTGAKPLLFMTWMKRPGSDWYKSHPNLTSPAYMQQSLDYYTNDLAHRANIPMVPVGDYWNTIVRNHPELDLYRPDGTHPSMQGTYLAALLFYKTITHVDLHGITYVPPGVAERAAGELRELASK